ncbi:MAG TPA: DUF2142 domain-containing protein [Anaerolineae bacterium]|nr:DUF2142 domain-containing protein [Anaerolineae bacterium]
MKWVLMLLALVQGLTYAALVPPWQAPDEPRHFEVVRLVAAQGRVPSSLTVDPSLEQEIIASMRAAGYWRWGFSLVADFPEFPVTCFDEIYPEPAHQFYQPPLYYLLAATVLRLAPDLSTLEQLYLLRGLSAVLLALAVLFADEAAAALFPTDMALRTGMPAFVALLPMAGFLGGAVTNDALVLPVEALLWWMSLLTLRDPSWRRAAGMLVAALALAFTKRTGLASALTVFGMTAWLWLTRRKQGIEDTGARTRRGGHWIGIWKLGVGLVIVVALAVWQAWGRLEQYFHLPGEVGQFLRDGTYWQALGETPWLPWLGMLFQSFWARFGWLNVPLPGLIYWIIGVASLLALTGLLCQRGKWVSSIWGLPLFSAGFLLTLALILGKEILFLSYRAGVVPQGRYLFPVLIPIAMLYVLGWLSCVPSKHRRVAAAIMVLAMYTLNIYCLWGVIRPFYSQ